MGVLLLLLVWLVARLQGDRVTAALMLLGALLPTADTVTDLLLASQWLRCGHALQANLTFGIVGLSTLIIMIITMDSFFYKLGIRGVLAGLFQVGPLHAAIKAVFNEDHLNRSQGSSRDAVNVIKVIQSGMEAGPLAYLQAYVLLRLDLESNSSPLTCVSVALSVTSVIMMLDNFAREGNLLLPRSLADVAVHFLLTVCGLMCRLLAAAVFGSAFKAWLAVALSGALVGSVAVFKVFATSPMTFRDAILGSLIAGPVPVVTNDEQGSGYAAVQVWVCVVTPALAVPALLVPSEWRDAQTSEALEGIMRVFIACVVGKLLALIYFIATKGKVRQGLLQKLLCARLGSRQH